MQPKAFIRMRLRNVIEKVAFKLALQDLKSRSVLPCIIDY